MLRKGHRCVVNKLAFFALLKMSPQWKELYLDRVQIGIFWYLIYMTIHTLSLKRPVHILCPYLPCNPSGKHPWFVGASVACLYKTIKNCRQPSKTVNSHQEPSTDYVIPPTDY